MDGLSLAIETGEFVGVVGTSGSGKTTLLNLIGGLDTATSGLLEVMGQRLDALDSRQLALYRRTTVGIVFQAFHLLPARSAFDNVELPLLLQNVMPRDREPRVEAALEQVGLTARRDHLPSELSASIRLGDTAGALPMIEELRAPGSSRAAILYQNVRGQQFSLYWAATIAALLDRKQEAVALIREWLNHGGRFGANEPLRPEWESLKEHPLFQELVRIRD